MIRGARKLPIRLLASRVLRSGVLALGILAFEVIASDVTGVESAVGEPGAASPSAPPRVVSLNPSLTAILLALGAAESLVGVDDYSARIEPSVRDLPTVGGLFNPSLEAIVALAPDLVVLVPSAQQRDLRGRLESLGVTVLALDNITLDQAVDSISRLGERVGRAEAARARVSAIRRTWTEVERESDQIVRPRTVLVLQRDPLYVVGGGSFLDAMLEAAGARNLGAELSGAYPRAGAEWLIAARPELILDASPDAEEPGAYWARWPSLPAVTTGAVVRVRPELVTLPGPYLDRALRELARGRDTARGA